MSAIIEIIKRYVFEIACGLACVVGIVLIILGLGSMDEVRTKMQGGLTLQGQIDNFLRDRKPINKAAIEQEERRIEQVKKEYERVMEFAANLNAYQPLTDSAFPESSTAARTQFRYAFQQQVGKWLDQLNAGQEPTAVQIESQKAFLIAEQEEAKMLGEKDDSGDARDQQRSIEQQARILASQNIAKKRFIYASPESFQSSRISEPGGAMDRMLPPEPEEMWYAQLEVWIQDQIVQRIASVNETSAASLKDKVQRLNADGKSKEALPFKPWIGNLPIKELVSIQIGDGADTYYVMDGVPGRGRTESRDNRAFPPNNSEEVFTGDKSTPLYELVQFAVRLVVDARDLPAIVAGLSEESFIVPLSVTYERTPANLSMEGKIYGDEPTITVTIQFQTLFFSEYYLAMMPDKILEKLNKKRPEPGKDA